MPQAAIAAVANFFLAVTGAYSVTATAIAYFAAQVFVYAAANYLLNRAAASFQKNPRNSGLGQGMEVNYYDSGAPIRIVYGRVRTGGMETIPPLTTGQDNAFMHKVLTLAGHEVDSYNYAHLDTTTITNAQIGAMAFTGSDGAVSSGSFGSHVWMRRYRGTSTDSADRMLLEVDSTAFNKSRAPGIAKVALTYKFNAEVFRSMPSVTFTYQGKRCYDPRLDVTPGASPTNPSYIAWTQNPALCLCDYLMAVYGGEYASTDIDWDSVVTAANYCDGSVTTPSGSQARYTCNGVLLANDAFEDNVRLLVDSMLGRIIFRDGKWRIFAGSWQTPSFTVLKTDWIEGGLSIRFEQGRARRFNRMRCWYVDPTREWQRVESLPRVNTTYKTADGGESIDAQTDQLMCTLEFEAQRKSEFLLRQSRNQITVTGRLPPRFQNIALWDTGTVVFDHLGWSSKTFRCVACDMIPDGSMDVVFAEEQSEDWTDLVDADYNGPSTASLPTTNVIKPSVPTSFAVTQKIDGTLLFQWGRPVVEPYASRFQIFRSTNSGNASVGTVVWEGDANPVALVMPTSRHWYWVRTRANSQVSAYTPNTFGVMGEAYAEADNTLSSSVIPDEEFEYSDIIGRFWGTTSTNVFSLSVIGGITGGKVTITATRDVAANNSVFLFAIPNSPFIRLYDSNVTIGLRYRANSISAVDSGANTGPSFHLVGWTGVGTPNVNNTLVDNGLPNIFGSAFRIQTGSVGIGNWDTVLTQATSIATAKPILPGNINPSSYPYLAGRIALVNAGSGGSVWEVDRVWFRYI